MQVEPITLTGEAAAAWGPEGYETTLQLVTGRTHQIRAQMAAIGCPLLGDLLYAALREKQSHEQQQQQGGGRQSHQQQQQEEEEEGQDRSTRCGQIGSTGTDNSQPHRDDGSLASGLTKDGSRTLIDSVTAGAASYGGASWARAMQEDPLKPLGLQAYKMRLLNAGELDSLQQPSQKRVDEMDEGVLVLTAGSPWWRGLGVVNSTS